VGGGNGEGGIQPRGNGKRRGSSYATLKNRSYAISQLGGEGAILRGQESGPKEKKKRNRIWGRCRTGGLDVKESLCETRSSLLRGKGVKDRCSWKKNLPEGKEGVRCG